MDAPMPRPHPFLAGAARTTITPPVGVAIEGSFEAVYADEILDELYANALVLDDGTTEVALVAVDVAQLGTALYERIAAEVAARSGIPRDRVFVTSTHTHNGPVLGNFVVDDRPVDADYVGLLPRLVAGAVDLARRRKRPARLAVARAERGRHVFNRRLRRPDGSIVMNWHDRRRLQGCEPAAPVDPEVLMLKVTPVGGDHPLAFVVNYALHNNAVGAKRAISADFAGVLANTLRRCYGDEVVTLFLPGAMGDVNWVDHRRDQDRTRLYRQIGLSLAGAVMQAEVDFGEIAAPSLAVQRITPTIPERPWDEHDLSDKDVFRLADDHDHDHGLDLDRSPFYRAYRRWVADPTPPATFDLDVRALRLGAEVALSTNQTEFFAELGMEVKATSPFPFTMLATLTNGNAGYVPTRRAFAEGGYEVKKYPENSFLAVDAGERIVAASLDALRAVAGAPAVAHGEGPGDAAAR